MTKTSTHKFLLRIFAACLLLAQGGALPSYGASMAGDGKEGDGSEEVLAAQRKQADAHLLCTATTTKQGGCIKGC